jgi:tRNA threonylcarbamoyladenosine biosynthesis protein TsaB
MKLLALEFSTEKGSLALLEDGAVVAQAAVAAGHRRSQGLFEAAAVLVQEAGWGFGDLEAFAVGRGPGAYTGLRVSLTAANGWALPGGRPVWTVSSAAARAAELLAEQPGLPSVVVWGEARRGTVWAGLFERAESIRVRQAGDWRLLPAAERGQVWLDAPWAEAGGVPKAQWVGRLYFAGDVSEELQPVYLHPAVTAAPRFDADGRPLT